MNIYVNSKPIETGQAANLMQVLIESGFADKKGIAVAVNNSVVCKANWGNQQLSENDKIIVISATKGG